MTRVHVLQNGKQITPRSKYPNGVRISERAYDRAFEVSKLMMHPEHERGMRFITVAVLDTWDDADVVAKELSGERRSA